MLSKIRRRPTGLRVVLLMGWRGERFVEPGHQIAMGKGDRLLAGKIATAFFEQVLAQAKTHRLLPTEVRS